MSHDADQRLIEAVNAGADAAVAQALSLGADPNITVGRFRGSVLAEAARSGRSGIVRLLLDAGARVAPADPHGTSPLRAAVLEAHPAVVRSLLACGALEAEPAARSSVLLVAVSSVSFHPTPAALEVLRVLLDSGATPEPHEESPLISAVMRSVAPVVLRTILAHGADADQRRSDAAPAIVVAARRGDHAAVDVLLQAGADVDACDARGRTALMHAVERNERRVADALLLAGAAIDAVSADGMTALRLARGWQWQNIQFRLGERSVGLDDVPIARTAVRLVPTGVRLTGDPQMFRRLAAVIDIAVDDLGADEWRTRTGTDAEAAAAFAARLREEAVPAVNASWHELHATVDEFATVRAALGELAYGTTRLLPDGTGRLDVVDLLEELNRQLGR
ncbi:ankyrin repeat domain-containing protein [Streptosporangium sp. NBC_01639]|uniref:ankyrin repeat domain-containing protein n=1 Tax=Streptosporangium sp. NBC_01639 TaxID=2975948 RepID=UPI00386AF48D|nr:ankyrin repeat domain-containing protein [Streptosporangium sp. NBC_01639]